MNLLLHKGGSSIDMLAARTHHPPKAKRCSFMSLRIPTLEPLERTIPNRETRPASDTPTIPEEPPPPEVPLAPVVPSNSTVHRAAPPLRTQVGFAPAAPLRPGGSDDPVIDSEVPGVLRIAAARQISVSGVTFEKLDPLPASVSDPSFNFLLKKKMDICCEILDFLSPNAQLQEKEIKSRTLCELIELFENPREVMNLTEEQKSLVFHMLDVNILGQDPVCPTQYLTVDHSLTVIEPAWPHLFYCYQLLNRFIQLFPNSKCLTIETVKVLIHLTQLPDTNERMQLIAFLRTYFDKRETERPEIARLIEKKLIDIQDGTATPFCAMPLLVVLAHVLNRCPSLINFRKVLSQIVLPLLGLRFLPLYYQNLRQLIVGVVEKNSGFVHVIFRKLELLWPHTSGCKQRLFLEILITLSSKIPQDIFRPFARRIFKFLGECVLSPHLRVSDVAMSIWGQATPTNWIGLNSRLAIQGMFDDVMTVIDKSIYPKCVEKAKQALVEMAKLNKNVYHKCSTLYKQKKAQRYKSRVPNDAQRGWIAVAKAARERFPEFGIRGILQEAHDLFHHETEATLAMTHFIPMLKKDVEKSIADSVSTPAKE